MRGFSSSNTGSLINFLHQDFNFATRMGKFNSPVVYFLSSNSDSSFVFHTLFRAEINSCVSAVALLSSISILLYSTQRSVSVRFFYLCVQVYVVRAHSMRVLLGIAWEYRNSICEVMIDDRLFFF